MAETCCVCGKYIGFWNLRYDACDITCTRCCMVGALLAALGGSILPSRPPADEPVRRKARERHARKLKKKERTTLANA